MSRFLLPLGYQLAYPAILGPKVKPPCRQNAEVYDPFIAQVGLSLVAEQPI
jgi:hypothetical protein